MSHINAIIECICDNESFIYNNINIPQHAPIAVIKLIMKIE